MKNIKAVVLCVGAAVVGVCFASSMVTRPAVPLRASPPVISMGNIGEGRQVSVNVVLSNTSNKDLTIQTIATSCGCTTAIGQLKHISSHESVPISIKFDSTGRVGFVNGEIVILTKEYPDNPIKVNLEGNVIQVARINPPIVQLGTLHALERKSFTFTLTGMNGRRFKVIGSSSKSNTRLSMKSVKPGVIQITGVLNAPLISGEYRNKIVLELDDPLLSSVSVPIEYSVSSQYDISVREINFGLVRKLKTVSRVIRIKGPAISMLKVLKIPRGIQMTLKRESNTSCIAVVQLSAEDNQVLLSDRVVMATGNAQQPELAIPVYAAFDTGASYPPFSARRKH